MQRTFLNTQAEYTSSGAPVRSHPDTDSIPVVKIYRDIGDQIIETPTVTKTTINYLTGHYSYPLDANLYIAGEDYYDIVTFIYNSNTMVTDRRYFRWGFADSVTGTAADGYNYNFLLALRAALEDNVDLVADLGHDPPDDPRLILAQSQQVSGPNYPCMTYTLVSQLGLSNSNLGSFRTSILKCMFWDPTDELSLITMNDKLIIYLSESESFQGKKINTSDLVFVTFNAEYDQTITDPEGLSAWEENQHLYAIGSRYIIRAACF